MKIGGFMLWMSGAVHMVCGRVDRGFIPACASFIGVAMYPSCQDAARMRPSCVPFLLGFWASRLT